MKKLFAMIALLMTVVISGYALSESAVVLHHGNEVTVFDGPDKIEAAIEAAVDGDVIYLNKGTYLPFTVSKDITIRGAGNDQTIIGGDIGVAFTQAEAEEGVDVPQRTTLEGLYCNNIYWNKSTRNRKISKCNFLSFNQSNTYNYNFTVDRCYCRSNFSYSNYIDGLSIINSKIYNFNVGNCSTSTNIEIYRSNFYFFDYAICFRGSLINCIVGCCSNTNNSSYYNFNYSTIKNSFIGDGYRYFDYVEWENSYQINRYLISYTLDCSFPSDEELDALFGDNPPTLKYSDVGCYSGDTPFTLALSAPIVKTADIDVDNAKKTLNVRISLVGDTEENEDSENSAE